MTIYAIGPIGYWHIIHKTTPVTSLCQEGGSRLKLVKGGIVPPDWTVCPRCLHIHRELQRQKDGR